MVPLFVACTTDRGVQFQSKLFINFPSCLNLNNRTTANHRSPIGLVGKFHLIKSFPDPQLSWNQMDGRSSFDHVQHPYHFKGRIWFLPNGYGVCHTLAGTCEFCHCTDVVDPSVSTSYLQSYIKTLRSPPTHPTFVPLNFQKI